MFAVATLYSGSERPCGGCGLRVRSGTSSIKLTAGPETYLREVAGRVFHDRTCLRQFAENEATKYEAVVARQDAAYISRPESIRDHAAFYRALAAWAHRATG